MATTNAMRLHEDQENRRIQGVNKENNKPHQQQQQQPQLKQRAVLGVLSNNFVRNGKPLADKDEKPFGKSKAPSVSAYSEPFQVYTEPYQAYVEKKEEPAFEIYDDTQQNEVTEINTDKQDLEDDEELVVLKATEPTVKVLQREAFGCYKQSSIQDVVQEFRPAIQEIEESQGNAFVQKDTPMSVTSECSTDKKEKSSNSNFYDVDEYRADIYQYFRDVEVLHRPKPGYMKKQPDINHSMRTILVDWLVEVSEEYRLHTETLYLAVSYIDRFLSYMSVVRAKLQLVGTAALFIAAKYEEIYPPEVTEFVYITDDTYTKKQVLRMEHLILRVLSFDLTVPTPLAFLMDYCLSNNLSDKVQHLAMYICELSLLDADPFLQFVPSHLAAASIALARHTMRQEIWPHELQLSTGYELDELKRCIRFLHTSFKTAPHRPQTAIQEKYKHAKYGHVSMILPRNTEPFDWEDSESA
ncbi:hypothetical protein TKK_0016257 [Trichogramma kaykai]|uniref:Cyclin-A2 n=1 Tax=Trichogramma kaykai TaxID=54128 RepID=A0ABD2W808_9HYME